MFALIKTNDSDDYEYYVIRCQRRAFKRQFKNVQIKFSNLKMLLKLTCNPNYINLYNRMKETMRDKNNWQSSYFDITDNNVYSKED